MTWNATWTMPPRGLCVLLAPGCCWSASWIEAASAVVGSAVPHTRDSNCSAWATWVEETRVVNSSSAGEGMETSDLAIASSQGTEPPTRGPVAACLGIRPVPVDGIVPRPRRSWLVQFGPAPVDLPRHDLGRTEESHPGSPRALHADPAAHVERHASDLV